MRQRPSTRVLPITCELTVRKLTQSKDALSAELDIQKQLFEGLGSRISLMSRNYFIGLEYISKKL